MITSLLLFAIISIVLIVVALSRRVATIEHHMNSVQLQLLKEHRNVFALISHELKTPITIVVGHLEILRDKQKKAHCLSNSQSLKEIEKAILRLESYLQRES